MEGQRHHGDGHRRGLHGQQLDDGPDGALELAPHRGRREGEAVDRRGRCCREAFDGPALADGAAGMEVDPPAFVADPSGEPAPLAGHRRRQVAQRGAQVVARALPRGDDGARSQGRLYPLHAGEALRLDVDLPRGLAPLQHHRQGVGAARPRVGRVELQRVRDDGGGEVREGRALRALRGGAVHHHPAGLHGERRAVARLLVVVRREFRPLAAHRLELLRGRGPLGFLPLAPEQRGPVHRGPLGFLRGALAALALHVERPRPFGDGDACALQRAAQRLERRAVVGAEVERRADRQRIEGQRGVALAGDALGQPVERIRRALPRGLPHRLPSVRRGVGAGALDDAQLRGPRRRRGLSGVGRMVITRAGPSLKCRPRRGELDRVDRAPLRDGAQHGAEHLRHSRHRRAPGTLQPRGALPVTARENLRRAGEVPRERRALLSPPARHRFIADVVWVIRPRAGVEARRVVGGRLRRIDRGRRRRAVVDRGDRGDRRGVHHLLAPPQRGHPHAL